MAYQQQYKRPSLAKGRAASAAKKNGKTQWVTIGVGWNRPSGSKLAMNTILNIGGHGLKFRAFWTDKSKSNSKNPSDVTFTIPKEEIPEDLVDLLVPEDQEEAQA
tara:strand:- start:838 stop:1152 length:315 start_codon:yes stop_codon:yes gene_type:complete